MVVVQLNHINDAMDQLHHSIVLHSAEVQSVHATRHVMARAKVQANAGSTFAPCAKQWIPLRMCELLPCSRLHPDRAESLLNASVKMPPEICLSGKMEVLDRMLVKLSATGHKVMHMCLVTKPQAACLLTS